MNQAEHVMAIVSAAIERKCMPPEEGARILAAALAVINRDDHVEEDLYDISREVIRRYGWVMVEEENKPW